MDLFDRFDLDVDDALCIDVEREYEDAILAEFEDILAPFADLSEPDEDSHWTGFTGAAKAASR